MQRIIDESIWQAALQAVPDYLIVVDPENRIQSLNRMPLDYTAQQLIGKELSSLLSPPDLIRNVAQRTLVTGALSELEVQWAATERWYLLRMTVIRDRFETRGMVVHLADIDEAKRRDRERAVLRAKLRSYRPAEPDVSEQVRLELMADELPILISYVDKEQRYQYNNAAYERWFGLSSEETRGRTVEQVLGTEAYLRIQPYIDAALRGEKVRFENLVPYRDAGLRQVVARYIPNITPDGETQGFYVLVEDVSDRREAEAALRHRDDELRELQKMEALGRLAGGIAHEFNNLLQVIVGGYSSIQLAAEVDSKTARDLERVNRAAQRGISLTRQLLSFSRQREPQVNSVDLDILLGDLMILLEPILGPKIQLESALQAGCEAMVDAGQMQQVIMNLAINARDAMPEGGTLRITTEKVTILPTETPPHAGLKPGRYVEVTLADTGVGMEEETLKRIFDPFFTTKPEGEGTGLGLSTVYGIIQNLGGHIDVGSELGKGTNFRMRLPLVPQA